MSKIKVNTHELFKDCFHNYTVKKGDLKPGDFYLSTNVNCLYIIFEEDGIKKYKTIYGVSTSGSAFTNNDLDVYPEKK